MLLYVICGYIIYVIRAYSSSCYICYIIYNIRGYTSSCDVWLCFFTLYVVILFTLYVYIMTLYVML